MLKLALTSPWNNAPIYYKAVTTSTMEDAAHLVYKKAIEGTVIMTGFQEQGRGRFTNRKWQAMADKNLLFTLLLNQRSFSGYKRILPLLIGLAVAKTIEELFNIRLQIKWPNDVLYKEKKIAGVLCQKTNKYYLIGAGINCNQETFSKELKNISCSLWQIFKHSIDINELLIAILNSIKLVLKDSAWKEKLEQRLYHKEKTCTVIWDYGTQQKQFTGAIVGVGEKGELLVKSFHSTRLHKIVSGRILN